jgi:succinate dehydrogenase / fumarate reductase cytochrome b subunit
MSNNNRPLSPHLQVYRWEITMFLSILHRATGVALAVGALVFTLWLLATLQGGYSFTLFYTFAKTPAGILVAFGWLFALSFHFLNGIRHLVWDTGTGFDKRTAKISGWVTLGLAFVMTVVVWNYARGVYAQPDTAGAARPAVSAAGTAAPAAIPAPAAEETAE